MLEVMTKLLPLDELVKDNKFTLVSESELNDKLNELKVGDRFVIGERCKYVYQVMRIVPMTNGFKYIYTQWYREDLLNSTSTRIGKQRFCVPYNANFMEYFLSTFHVKQLYISNT